jgi:hypothetical protein
VSGNTFNGAVEVIGGNLTVSDNTFEQGANLYGVTISATRNNIYGGLHTGGTAKFSGNFYEAYNGRDPDLDGIGDTPYVGNGASDNSPYMRPYGWLTKFYLTLDTNLPSSTPFLINGSSFNMGKGGTITLRLGYVASYSISLPQSLALANGSNMIFVKWGDGMTSPTRTIKLSSNSTLTATYALQAPTITTTTSSSTTTSSTTSTMSTTSSSSTATTPSISTASSPSSTGGGGIPEFSFQVIVVLAFVVVIALSYVIVRRRVPAKA